MAFMVHVVNSPYLFTLGANGLHYRVFEVIHLWIGVKRTFVLGYLLISWA